MTMNIAFAASEVYPFAKSGGLADVAGTLPKELAYLGHNVKVFMPKYYSISETKFDLDYMWDFGAIPVRVADYSQSVHIFKGFMPDSKVEIYFIDAPHYFHRSKLYTNDSDEDERFILFSKAVIETIQRLGWKPDVIHCNDWQTGLIPLYLKDNYSWDKLFENTVTLFTIHNIGYQGKFSIDALYKGEINPEHYHNYGKIEHAGDVNFLKAGISFADIINTVSETYAKEILTEEFGAGLHYVLQYRSNDLYGVLNGVDYNDWSPEKDKLIPYNYSVKDLAPKEKNKRELCKRMSLEYRVNVPLIGIVSRLAIQKGFDLITSALNELMKIDAQWVVLGSGEYKYEHLFTEFSESNPEKFAIYIGFNNELAHLIEAGTDIFLMPSHYEPCGLNQIYSLKYATVPVVRKTGGLADTVQDWDENKAYDESLGNGFVFQDYNETELIHCLRRAVNYYQNKDVWRKIQQNGMSRDYSWSKSAKKYQQLYTKALEKLK